MSVTADSAARGLRTYVHRIATALGIGPEGTYCEVAEISSAYIALGGHLARHPARDVALTWDDARGWAVGVETRSGEDLLVVAWYGPDPVPAPDDVVGFAKDVFAGERAGRPTPPRPYGDSGAVLARLATYASGT